MNKIQMVKVIASSAGLTQVASEKAITGFIDAVKDVLKSGESLTLPGFGTFTVVERAARKGRNPQTGDSLTIAARKVVKFKAGANLVEAVGLDGSRP